MKELGIDKVRGVLRRRRVVVGTSTLGVATIAAILVWQLDPSYKASAVIRVAEAQPAKEYVPPTVAEQIGDRLRSLRLAVMGRPLVERAVRELDLGRAWPRSSFDEIVDAIRARMDVKVEGEDTFLLTYLDADPERARAVTNRVAQLFMQAHLDRRRQIATATTATLRAEVGALLPRLQAAQESVRAFKLAHYGALPEQQESNLRTLDQITLELNIQSTNLDVDLERRRQLLAAAASPLRHQEELLEAQLHDARTRYTPDHPEVRRIAAERAQVRADRLADERDLATRVRRDNPELVGLDAQIARLRALLAGLRGRQAEVRRRVQATAKNGHELAALSLDHDAIKDKYLAAQAHLREAELALQLEHGLAPLRFDLVEGASLPQQATAPDRSLLAAGGLILALAIGLGLGFLLDARDPTVRDPATLGSLAPPLLACIPHLSGDGSRRSDAPREEA